MKDIPIEWHSSASLTSGPIKLDYLATILGRKIFPMRILNTETNPNNNDAVGAVDNDNIDDGNVHSNNIELICLIKWTNIVLMLLFFLEKKAKKNLRISNRL